MERDLAQLTLSDPEQRELYEAARLVQTAFCKYKVQAHPPTTPEGSGAVCPSAQAVGCVFDRLECFILIVIVVLGSSVITEIVSSRT